MKELLMALHARADKYDRLDAPELFARLDAWVADQTQTPEAEAAIEKIRRRTDDDFVVDDNPAIDPVDEGIWVNVWVWVPHD